MTVSGNRTFAVWVPDWPVVAAAAELALDESAPIALIQHGVVFACSAAARSAGVARGIKQREAQYRCPSLTVARYDESADARRFEACVRAVEQVVPRVQVVRPGLVAVRARGPIRFFGGEANAAQQLRDSLLEAALRDVRVGCADGLFAAEQAARATTQIEPISTVASADTVSFLAPLSVELVSTDARMAVVLKRLGIHTLGQFAALESNDVQRRFGSVGVWAHEQAAGRDPQRLVARDVPPEFTVEFRSDTPLERSDEIAFALRESAERFDSQLRSRRLVCTAIRIELVDEHETLTSRVWLHPRWLSATDVIDRVRWQLDGLFRANAAVAAGSFGDSRLELDEGVQRAGIVLVRLVPDRVDSTEHHESGLWGGGPDARVHHALSRAQSLLGPDGVATAVLTGGRTSEVRQQLVPWGDAPPPSPKAAQPWPGAIDGVAPSTLIWPPMAVGVFDQWGQPLSVSERGVLSAAPSRLQIAAAEVRTIVTWAGPWVLEEHWWSAEASGRRFRCQVCDETGDAWLLSCDGVAWSVEARYD